MDITWVGGMEGSKNKENLAGSVTGGVEESRSSHFKGILQARLTFGILSAQTLDFGDVIGGIAADIADSHSESISHTDYSELRYGILLEELSYKFFCVSQHQEIASRS